VNLEMVSYKFYFRNPKGVFEFIGVLPERRRDPERISDESILNWGRNYFAKNLKEYEDIFFVETVLTDI
jgi:hypothetical protein